MKTNPHKGTETMERRWDSVSILYVSDPEARLSFKENRVIATYPDGAKHSLPVESVESITLLTKVQITTQCLEECLSRGIPVAFFSKGGRYFGRLVSTGHVNAALQRCQSALYDTPFAVELSRRILAGKIKNQQVVMRRYAKSRGIDVQDLDGRICIYMKKVSLVDTIEEMMGYEGQCAKLYFQGLSRCIEPAFSFRGRSRRPPMDPFNSLISLGCSVLMNEVYNEIETKGLHPYFGFMHRDAEKHPTM